MFSPLGQQTLFFLMLEKFASLPSSREETSRITGAPLIWREGRDEEPHFWTHSSSLAGSCPDRWGDGRRSLLRLPCLLLWWKHTSSVSDRKEISSWMARYFMSRGVFKSVNIRGLMGSKGLSKTLLNECTWKKTFPWQILRAKFTFLF